VISWSGDDSRLLSQCHLGLPPYTVDGSFLQQMEEAANTPLIKEYDGQTVALARGVTLTFDSAFGEGIQGAFPGNSDHPVPQTLHTNDDNAQTGTRRTGAKRQELTAGQMAQLWEVEGKGGLTGRQAAAEAELSGAEAPEAQE
jgi:hypothetical protein